MALIWRLTQNPSSSHGGPNDALLGYSPHDEASSTRIPSLSRVCYTSRKLSDLCLAWELLGYSSSSGHLDRNSLSLKGTKCTSYCNTTLIMSKLSRSTEIKVQRFDT